MPNGAGSLAGGSAAANARWGYYNFVAVAPGYGHLRFKVKNLKAGEARNITLHFPTNYASAAQGATVTTDAPATGTNLTPDNLIDDNEATSNTQSCTPTATCNMPVNGRWVVIKLGNAGTGVSINRLGVSAFFSSRFVGLRSFDAYSCRSDATPTASNLNPTCDGNIAAGWTKIVTGPVDSFPGANPRPGTQDESLRYFDASPQPIATHLKFVATNNQCTGQPSFHGDQDLDPGNNSECRSASAAARSTRPRSRSSRPCRRSTARSSPPADPLAPALRGGPGEPALHARSARTRTRREEMDMPRKIVWIEVATADGARGQRSARSSTG